MKLMKQLIPALALTIATVPAMAAELNFCPESWNRVNITGDSILEIWGVSLSGPLIANPDYGWPTEASIYTWYDMVIGARTNGTCVSIFYDPNPNGGSPNGHDICSMGTEG